MTEASRSSRHGGGRAAVLAVTGTDGKTSTAWFARRLLESVGVRAASFGTLGIVSEGERLSTPRCFPGRAGVDLLRDEMEREGTEVIVWEAFSSALSAGVLDQLEPTVAALTNLSRDHLDGHRTQARYVEAKERLFRHVLPSDGLAVLPADRPEGRRFRSIAAERAQEVLTFGCTPGADVRLCNQQATRDGTWIDVRIGTANFSGEVPIFGAMMLDNLLAALTMVLAVGIDARLLSSMPAKLAPPPGRVEHVATIDGACVYVDYAHTPAALEAVLDTLRPRCHGRLHLVFGCGGERDAGKRPGMGAVAHRLADIIIVTDDNPRLEDPGRIRASVLFSCPRAHEIADRREAIRTALAGLRPGDMLVVAGKGSEATQSIGDEDRPFLDRRVIEDCL